MNAELRGNLLDASKSGKNAHAKGVTGKLRDLFERMLEPRTVSDGGEIITFFDHDMFASAEFGMLPMPSVNQWSLRNYRQAAEDGHTPKEIWDELEKSVVANLADDVQIGIVGSNVEMIIFKKF